jgi:hypothetical protein
LHGNLVCVRCYNRTRASTTHCAHKVRLEKRNGSDAQRRNNRSQGVTSGDRTELRQSHSRSEKSDRIHSKSYGERCFPVNFNSCDVKKKQQEDDCH